LALFKTDRHSAKGCPIFYAYKELLDRLDFIKIDDHPCTYTKRTSLNLPLYSKKRIFVQLNIAALNKSFEKGF